MFRMTTDAKKFEKALQKMGESALKKATARTLNAIAFGASKAQAANLKARMIVRTPFTEKSMRMYKASEAKPIDRQNAVVGSVSPYLPVHDDGGMVRAKKKYLGVPANWIRGPNRRRKIPNKFRLSSMGDFKKNPKFFVLNPTRNPNKPRVRHGKIVPYRLKRPTVFYRQDGELVCVHRFVKVGVKVKANHWHTDAVKKYAKVSTISAVFTREAKKILAELGAK